MDARSLALQWRKIQREILDQQEYIPYKENVTLALKRTGEQLNFAATDYPARLFSKWVEITPYDDVEETLQTLGANHRLAICTNSVIDLF